MISASTAFINAVGGNGRTFRAKILKNGSEVSCDIKTLSFVKGAFGDEVFTVGGVYASQLTITAVNLAANLENQDIELQIGVLTGNDTFDFITVGKWTITKVRATTQQTELTGLGFIATKLDGLMPNIATQTIANIISAIMTVSGLSITLADTFDTSGLIILPVENLTCRDALEIVTGVLGGFATENASGGIEIHKFKIPTSLAPATPGRSLTPPELADNDFEMTGISVEGAGGTWSSGSPIRQIYTNQYMTQELFPAFAANIIGYEFRPGTIPLSMGDPRLEPWDCMEVTDLDNNTFNVPCHQIIHSFDGGFSSQIIASGESETEPVPRTPVMQRIEKAINQADSAITIAEDIEQQAASGAFDGANSATVYLYTRTSASSVSPPSTSSVYTFETGLLNPVPSGWYRSIPAANGAPLYVTQALAYSSQDTATILSTDWSTPVILAEDGATGATGPAGPEAEVTVFVSAINYTAGTATLGVTLRVNGTVTVPSSYKWTKGTSTTSLGTGSTVNISDLNATYNCTVTW